MSQNFNQPRDPWSRLTAAARQARDDRDAAMPYGFATRVAALALAQERTIVCLFDRFALRAVTVASLLALGSVALNYRAVTTAPVASAPLAASFAFDDYVSPTSDAVAVVLDIAD